MLGEEPTAGRFKSVALNISRGMAFIAALCLFMMMGITVIDVIGRYFFIKPLEGAFEIVAIMLVIAGSLGMGYTQLNNQHIRIGVITDRFSPRKQAAFYVLAYLVCSVAGGLIAWRGWIRGFQYFFMGIGSTTVTLHMPYWPFMMMLAIGFSWVTIIWLADLVKSLREVFRNGTN